MVSLIKYYSYVCTAEHYPFIFFLLEHHEMEDAFDFFFLFTWLWEIRTDMQLCLFCCGLCDSWLICELEFCFDLQ